MDKQKKEDLIDTIWLIAAMVSLGIMFFIS